GQYAVEYKHWLHRVESVLNTPDLEREEILVGEEQICLYKNSRGKCWLTNRRYSQDSFMDMIDYFGLKQPFWDSALVDHIKYYDLAAIGNGYSKTVEVYMKYIDEFLKIGLLASRDPTKFPLAWAAFREMVFDAAARFHRDTISKRSDQSPGRPDDIQWLDLIANPMWRELPCGGDGDCMRLISYGLAGVDISDEPTSDEQWYEGAVTVDDASLFFTGWDCYTSENVGPDFCLKVCTTSDGEFPILMATLERLSGASAAFGKRPVLVEGRVKFCDEEFDVSKVVYVKDYCELVYSNPFAVQNFPITISCRVKFTSL
ncbi:hypothetical protein EBT25_16265, partial [bacterium]|nr:hypothetical protein [bacterium]